VVVSPQPRLPAVLLALALGAAALVWALWPRGLSIGLSDWEGFAPIVFAAEKGLMRDPALAPIALPTAVREEALRAGRLDCAATTLNTWLQWADRGLDVVLIARTDVSRGGDAIVVRDAPDAPRDLAALRGRRIAAWRGGAPLLLLAEVLDRAGLRAADITLVDMGPEDAAAALLAGTLDAAVLYGRPLEENRARLRLLASSGEHPIVVGALGCRREAMRATLDLPRRLADALWRAGECLSASRTATLVDCPDRTGRALGFDFDALAGGRPTVGWETRASAPDRAAMRAALARARDLLAPFGVFVAAPVDVEKLTEAWVDP
jgi:NitT/TauT family transport system substrate-binding protein